MGRGGSVPSLAGTCHQAKAVSASTREAECEASWGLCGRCSFQEIITPCPFKLAPKIEHGEAAE